MDSCSDEDSMTITQFAKFLYLRWQSAAANVAQATDGGDRLRKERARRQKGRLGLEPTPRETCVRMMTTGTLRRAYARPSYQLNIKREYGTKC
jgi:hypothetical protein